MVALTKKERTAGLNWVELRQAYRTFLGDPSVGIRHILRAAEGSGWQRWVERRWMRQAQGLEAAVIEIDLQALGQLPPDTLGGAYARHMMAMGFNPEAFVTQDPRAWISRRAALGHDIHHVIVGFAADPVGEFGLAAFCWVQFWDLLNVFVLSFVPITILGYPRQTGALLKALARGFWLGLVSKPIMAFPYENHWQTPLTEVRRQLGIPAS